MAAQKSGGCKKKSTRDKPSNKRYKANGHLAKNKARRIAKDARRKKA